MEVNDPEIEHRRSLPPCELALYILEGPFDELCNRLLDAKLEKCFPANLCALYNMMQERAIGLVAQAGLKLPTYIALFPARGRDILRYIGEAHQKHVVQQDADEEVRIPRLTVRRVEFWSDETVHLMFTNIVGAIMTTISDAGLTPEQSIQLEAELAFWNRLGADNLLPVDHSFKVRMVSPLCMADTNATVLE